MADDLLILISSPPNNPKALTALRLTQGLRGQGRSVSLCLLQDGVLLALARQAAERIPALTSEIDVYALGEDLRMRGFGRQEVLPQVHLIDCEQLVDLMAGCRTMGIF
jgi:sulfur relay protein TusB/DsrH